MPSIHYIWWGNPGNPKLAENATATPNVMVNNVHGAHEVHYWIGGNRGFDAKLDPRIIQHSIGADPGAKLLKGTPLVGYAPKLTNILKSLDSFGAFAATKDLVSLAVMYRKGGYFFDTTTQIGLGYRKHIKRLLTDGPEPLAPYAADGSKGHKFVPGNESAKFTVDFGGGAKFMYGYASAEWVPSFDVWALYSPAKHHSAFETALRSYLTRAEKVGFLSANSTTVDTFPGKSLADVMNYKPTDEQKNTRDWKSPRDQVIGGMAISSLLEGFHHYAKANGKNLRDLGWPFVELNRTPKFQIGPRPAQQTVGLQPKSKTSSLTQEEKQKEEQETIAFAIFAGMGLANVTIPTIGIQKWFSGSWRAKNL